VLSLLFSHIWQDRQHFPLASLTNSLIILQPLRSSGTTIYLLVITQAEQKGIYTIVL